MQTGILALVNWLGLLHCLELCLKTAPETDTIAAVSTPPGRGGIGIVRLSGPQAVSIAGATCELAPAIGPCASAPG